MIKRIYDVMIMGTKRTVLVGPSVHLPMKTLAVRSAMIGAEVGDCKLSMIESFSANKKLKNSPFTGHST